jgi:hypothetical protein
MNPHRKGQAGNPVSTGMQSSTLTPQFNTHFILPYGLRLQQKVGMVEITNVVDAGATVVYTANNNYSAGNTVSIYYVNPVAYNLQNATILSATSTTFTITSAATGTYISGGVAQRTGSIPVTIPAGINFVYAIAVGSGGSGGTSQGGGGGGVAWGWTIATSFCLIANSGGVGYTRYGNVIAGGGAPGASVAGGAFLGGGGGGGSSGIDSTSGSTNYWGIPGGGLSLANSRTKGFFGSGGGGGGGSGSIEIAGAGGDGISGGGGAQHNRVGSGTNTGGAGGDGLVGGGGGQATTTTGTRIGGLGGNGVNILTGVKTTGGGRTTGVNTNGAGGGGAGIAGNGSNASGITGGIGGLGGGGGGNNANGGAGILYLFY